jgi:hypothetical protein
MTGVLNSCSMPKRRVAADDPDVEPDAVLAISPRFALFQRPRPPEETIAGTTLGAGGAETEIVAVDYPPTGSETLKAWSAEEPAIEFDGPWRSALSRAAAGSQRQPLLFAQIMFSPSPATPDAPWSLLRQNWPGS